MHSRNLNIQLTLENEGVTKKAIMSGIAFLKSGFITGKINREHTNLTPEECVLISAFSFTGCPIAANTETPGLNPWEVTGGAYKSTRSLDSDEFQVSSTLESTADNINIDMELNMKISGKLPKLSGIQKPFQESISESKVGHFRGEFEVLFASETGDDVNAKATSNYTLGIEASFPPVWRNITIVDTFGVSDFTQVEQIDLFGSSEQAKIDLLDKCMLTGFNGGN